MILFYCKILVNKVGLRARINQGKANQLDQRLFLYAVDVNVEDLAVSGENEEKPRDFFGHAPSQHIPPY